MQDQANTTAILVPWNKGKVSEGRTFQQNSRAYAAGSRSRAWERHRCDTTENSRHTRADIHGQQRYINSARHVRAFGVCIGIIDDGIDTIEQ